MKLDEGQERKLEAFEAEYQRYKAVRDRAEERIRTEVELEIRDAHAAAARFGREAVRAGVPISRLGTKDRPGLRTLNHKSIKRFIGLDEDAPKEAAVRTGDVGIRVRSVAEGYEVTLGDAEITATLAQRAGYTHPDAAPEEKRVATFERLDNGRIIPVTQEWDAESGTSNLVVLWYGNQQNRVRLAEAVETFEKEK